MVATWHLPPQPPLLPKKQSSLHGLRMIVHTSRDHRLQEPGLLWAPEGKQKSGLGLSQSQAKQAATEWQVRIHRPHCTAGREPTESTGPRTHLRPQLGADTTRGTLAAQKKSERAGALGSSSRLKDSATPKKCCPPAPGQCQACLADLRKHAKLRAAEALPCRPRAAQSVHTALGPPLHRWQEPLSTELSWLSQTVGKWCGAV